MTTERHQWQIGDRVYLMQQALDSGKLQLGDVGTVVRDYGGVWVGVSWDRDIDGHTCGGTATPQHGWNVLSRCLAPWLGEPSLVVVGGRALGDYNGDPDE